MKRLKNRLKGVFKTINIFTYIRDLKTKIGLFREENDRLKQQLINRRKIIKELKTNLLNSINDFNLQSEQAEQLIKRRDEFINRLSATPDASINNWADYKFWISEPFIVESFEPYKHDKDAIDGVSAIRGFCNLLKKIDEKD